MRGASRHWQLVVLSCSGSAMPASSLFNRWGLIRGFALGDTDDNLRMAQVRALLGGQGWFDLASTASTRRMAAPISTGRGWSTCRSPG